MNGKQVKRIKRIFKDHAHSYNDKLISKNPGQIILHEFSLKSMVKKTKKFIKSLPHFLRMSRIDELAIKSLLISLKKRNTTK